MHGKSHRVNHTADAVRHVYKHVARGNAQCMSIVSMTNSVPSQCMITVMFSAQKLNLVALLCGALTGAQVPNLHMTTV